MDNFYIKIHKGSEEAFYKKTGFEFKSKSWSKILGNERKEQFEYKNFDSEQLKNICFKQLLHSQALCENLPIKIDLIPDNKALGKRILEYKELYNGTFDTETDWRLALGLGLASVFETSITLHHTYGIPYIPASAVKGLLRSWLITEYFGLNENGELDLKHAEERALGKRLNNEAQKESSLSFYKIFGHEEACIRTDSNREKKAFVGDIVFFDAFPTTPPTVAVDIMNPHYPKYYNHEPGTTDFQPPADWQSPVPIFFLTIKDTSFQFLFGVRKGAKEFGNVNFNHPEDADWNKNGSVIDVLRDLLKEALTYQGIGAKTAVGYGRMK